MTIQPAGNLPGVAYNNKNTFTVRVTDAKPTPSFAKPDGGIDRRWGGPAWQPRTTARMACCAGFPLLPGSEMDTAARPRPAQNRAPNP